MKMKDLLLNTFSTYTLKDFAVILLIALATRWVYRNLIQPFLSPLRKIPGKPYRPLVGNMYEALNSEAMTNTIRWMKELKALTIRFYWFGGEERLLSADPKFFRHILVTNVNNYDRVRPNSAVLRLMGKALFFLSGEQHHHVRKLLNPAFNIKVLEGMLPIFEDHAQKVASAWNQMFEASTGDQQQTLQLPVQDYMSRITLDSICVTGLNFLPDAITEPDTSGVKSLTNYLRQLGRGSILRNLVPFYDAMPTGRNRGIWTEEAYVSDIIKKAIADKRQQYIDGEIDPDKTQPRDLLSLLILAKDDCGHGMPEDLIFENVAGLMFAGFDTTSITLTWILYLLAKHPDVQEKVRQEMLTILPDVNTAITHEHLDKMAYLNCVMKETQRLYPVVSSTVRTALEDDVIDGTAIPAGTKIVLHVGALHRMEQNWSDPEEFKPERFLENQEPYKHLPFLTGSYMCIGHKFAQFEMKIVLCCLLRNFIFCEVPGFKVRRIQALSVKPHPPLILNVKRIKDI